MILKNYAGALRKQVLFYYVTCMSKLHCIVL